VGHGEGSVNRFGQGVESEEDRGSLGGIGARRGVGGSVCVSVCVCVLATQLVVHSPARE